MVSEIKQSKRQKLNSYLSTIKKTENKENILRLEITKNITSPFQSPIKSLKQELKRLSISKPEENKVS